MEGYGMPEGYGVAAQCGGLGPRTNQQFVGSPQVAIDNSVPRESQTAQQVNRLYQATEVLAREIDSLRERVSTVLITAPTPAVGNSAPVPPMAPLAGGLSEIASRFENQIEQLRQLRKSIDL